MSYMSYPRVTFQGKFQADTSTVNNDPRHFSNRDFEERFQDFNNKESLNGWWNPRGTGIFRLSQCSVASVINADGKKVEGSTESRCTVGNSLNRPSAKIVDLDPDWQLASIIYGQQICITDPTSGEVLLTGDYEPYEFRDLWFSRSQGQSGDDAASAMFQSVLTNLCWHKHLENYPILQALKNTTTEDKLSVRLTTYGFSGEHTAAEFTYGTVLGAIGPYLPGEPESFVNERRFAPANASRGYSPAGIPNMPNAGVSNFSFVVDSKNKRLIADLSNALPLDKYFQPLPLGLSLVVLDAENNLEGDVLPDNSYYPIEKLNMSNTQLLQDSGIWSVPIPDKLLSLMEQHPLALINGSSLVIREELGGMTLRAEKFTQRLDPNLATNNKAIITFYASRYGKPVEDFKVHFQSTSPAVDVSNCPPDPPPGSTNHPSPTTPRAEIPTLDRPADAITIEPIDGGKTQNGTLQYLMQGPSQFGSPREYLDGQLYTIDYNFESGTKTIPQTFDNLAILVFSSFSVSTPPKWEEIQPILQQYANLYPIMSRGLFDFSKQKQADASAYIMRFVFDKDIKDPDYMPVTRDLSQGKRTALIDYFSNVIDNKKKQGPEQDSALARFAARCPMHRNNPPISGADNEAIKASPSYSKGRNQFRT